MYRSTVSHSRDSSMTSSSLKQQLSFSNYKVETWAPITERGASSQVIREIIERLSLTLRGRTSNGKNETFAVCI